MSTRVAILSDTHLPRGRRRLPDACVEQLRAADVVLHAGDIATVDVLREIEAVSGGPVHAVAGNVDGADLHAVLPETRIVAVEDVRIAMVHDAGTAGGRLRRMRKRFADADAVVFGHSHIPLHESEDGFAIFNPGSPTDRRRQPSHTMGRATVDGGHLSFELIVLD